MEHNIDYVMNSDDLREGARSLVERAVDTANILLHHEQARQSVTRGGRKANPLVVSHT
jgi:hypothetical protein